MTNEPSNHSAGIELSEDFVNRAIALRGGKNLDGEFLMDLLDAGLAILELSAGSHDERCGNPDCEGCRIQAQEPSPTIMAEFATVHAQLDCSMETARAGHKTERAITIVVSEASLIFMAWLDRMIESRSKGGLRVVGPDIDIEQSADMERAGRYLSDLVINSLELQMAGFVEGRHPLLFPRRGKPS
jgi:hypothetical protein